MASTATGTATSSVSVPHPIMEAMRHRRCDTPRARLPQQQPSGYRREHRVQDEDHPL